MKIIKIKQKKQENGLWGMPSNCYKIDKLPLALNDDKKLLLNSAIIAALSEIHSNFEIYNSSDTGFFVSTKNPFNRDILTENYILCGDMFKNFIIFYDNYEVLNDTLYEFENEKEHINFLRNFKLKKIEMS